MFGNALEVASRINTLGKPMKIHISVDTKLLLDSIEGFRIEYRGVFEIQVCHNLNNCQRICIDTNDTQFRIVGFFSILLTKVSWLQSKRQPRIDTYWLLGRDGNETSISPLSLFEDNNVPDYVKDLMFPSNTIPVELNVQDLISSDGSSMISNE